MYQRTSIIITIVNNYLQFNVTDEAPKVSGLPTRFTTSYLPKSSNFSLNYELIEDPKLGTVWVVNSVEIFHGSRMFTILSSEFANNIVTDGKTPFNALTFETFLTLNTGL